MSDPQGGLTRLEQLLPSLARLAGAALRVWRYDGRQIRTLAGEAPAAAWTPALNGQAESRQGMRLETPDGPAWFEPVADLSGVWLEVRGGEPATAVSLADAVGSLLAAERETSQVAAELSERYEEIDLIYTISEILGHTIRLDDAAQSILREVSTVVRARRATLLVHDQTTNVLRLVAARGVELLDADPIEVDDICSVAARVFREMRIVSYDPGDAGAVSPGCPEGRTYRGRAFLSVPVVYAPPGGPPRPIGVINLTDRLGHDAFTAGDRKLVAAIANQIGAAIENSRLVERERGQQRVQRELELAHDLQLKLLPSTLVIGDKADVAARCRPAESVGGDFYNLLRLHGDRVGVMIGDVSTHGFGAALIMALAMAASGIHAESAEDPSEVLRRLEESLNEELARTEMYLTLFYAVIDAGGGRLTYANAGHPHAFLVSGTDGTWTRLEATRPPLGLGAPAGADGIRTWRRKEDVLCLLTDGVVEAVGLDNERFGESRVLGHVSRMRTRSVREMLDAIFADLAAFTGGAPAADDRTVVLLRV